MLATSIRNLLNAIRIKQEIEQVEEYKVNSYNGFRAKKYLIRRYTDKVLNKNF